MVCRENPLRSAAMGAFKKMSRFNGDGVLHDAQTQSLLHEANHELEASTPITTEQQIALMDSYIAEIEADPNLTDGEKYRPYTGKAGQTGIVTRIQEAKQWLLTGKDRHGNPVTGAQLNSAAQLSAVLRMGGRQGSHQAAQLNFLEMNARHRGLSMKEVSAEWRALMNQSGDFSNISLKDSFRDKLGSGEGTEKSDTRPASLAETLSLAGMTARDQDELGQSGRERNAMAVMERRRLEAIAAQPSRPSMHDDFCAKRTFADPNNKGNLVRCGHCGQFGHEDAACPNDALVSQRDQIAADRQTLDNAVEATKWRKVLNADDEQLAEVCSRLYPDQTPDSLRATGTARIQELVGDNELSDRQIARRKKELDEAEADLRAAFDKEGGSVSWVQEARYNPGNGVLQITPHPYVRKDGTVTPPTPFRRRISPEAWAQLTDGTDTFGKRLHALGLSARDSGEAYGFENAADAAAAATVTKCNSCGQFASMNSQHRCPVSGGPSEEVPARNAANNQAFREAVRDGGRKLPPRPRNLVTGLSRAPGRPVIISDVGGEKVEGRMHVSTKAAVDEATATNSTIAEVGIQADLPGANVHGQVRVWSEDGQRYLSPFDDRGRSTLRCNCPAFASNGRCRHVDGIAVAAGNHYRAANGSRRRPDSNPEAIGGLSLDAPMSASSRVDYATLTARRAERNDEFLSALAKRSHAGTLANAPVTMPPTTMDGTPIAEPTTWSRDEEAAVGSRAVADIDLNDTVAVQKRLRKVLSGRGPRRTFPVSRDSDGGINIGIQRSARGSKTIAAQRRELRELLGLPANASLKNGYYIPPTGSARAEALDRVYGDPQRVQRSRWVLNPTSATLDQEHRGRVAAEHKF